MDGPGRKSASSLSVLPPPVAVRPLPLKGMNARQKSLWTAITESRHVDWFPPDTVPLLAEYVRGVDAANMLAKRIDRLFAADDCDDEKLKALLDMRDKEAKRLTSIATKLRLTNQSRYTPQAAGTASKQPKTNRPWASA